MSDMSDMSGRPEDEASGKALVSGELSSSEPYSPEATAERLLGRVPTPAELAEGQFYGSLRPALLQSRVDASLSQTEVSKRLGVGQSEVSRLETSIGPRTRLGPIRNYLNACQAGFSVAVKTAVGRVLIVGDDSVIEQHSSSAQSDGRELSADPTLSALVALIRKLNPYTNPSPDPVTGRSTGEMQLETSPPPSIPENAKADATTDMLSRISVEVERNTNWAFKGQTFPVKSAVRVPYRFPVMDASGKILYWQTEHLFFGYAGGDGPG